MTAEVEFRKEARNDASAAHQWYEEKRSGLGEQFALALEAKIGEIARHPESHPVVHRSVRRALIERFPYGVFYVTDPSRITVVAVFHARRDPSAVEDRG